jgi:hypothetical protein
MIISLYHTANSFHLFSFLFCCSLFSFLFFVSFPYNLYTFCCAEVPFFVAQSLGNFAAFIGFFLSCLFETFRQTLQAPTASFMAPSVKFGKKKKKKIQILSTSALQSHKKKKKNTKVSSVCFHSLGRAPGCALSTIYGVSSSTSARWVSL